MKAGSSTTKEGEKMNSKSKRVWNIVQFIGYIGTFVVLFICLAYLAVGCSYSTMQGRGYSFAGIGEKPIETATAYSIVTSADTQREVVHNQFAVQKQMFDACTKSGRTDCYLLLGGFGYYPGMVGSGGWWQPNEYQSDRTYYNR